MQHYEQNDKPGGNAFNDIQNITESNPTINDNMNTQEEARQHNNIKITQMKSCHLKDPTKQDNKQTIPKRNEYFRALLNTGAYGTATNNKDILSDVTINMFKLIKGRYFHAWVFLNVTGFYILYSVHCPLLH